MNHKITGDRGEDAAVEYLRAAGYVILERNYRLRTGEIDIIARHKGVLVFIEVKTRTGTRYGQPGEAVTKTKQRRIICTALYYLSQVYKHEAECRFDVIEVMLPPQGAAAIHHIADAFCR